MANETSSFLSSFNKYIFTNLPEEGIFIQRPNRWAITIHSIEDNPTGAILDDSWYTDPVKRKSIASVLGWIGINDDFSQGIANSSLISFDYVPSGQTWTIRYYIIWGIVTSNGIDTFYPIYQGQFSNDITLEELQVLQFPPNTFKLIP